MRIMNAEEILQYLLVVSNVDHYRNGVAKTLVDKMDVVAKWIEMSKDQGSVTINFS